MGMTVRMEVHTASQVWVYNDSHQELVQDSLAPKFQSELSCHQAPRLQERVTVLHPFPGVFELMLWPRRASGQLLPYKWGMG